MVNKKIVAPAVLLVFGALVLLIWMSAVNQKSEVTHSGGVSDAESAQLKIDHPNENMAFGNAISESAASALAATDRIPLDRAHDRREARELISSVCLPARQDNLNEEDWLSVRIHQICADYDDPDYLNADPDELANLQQNGTRAHVEALLDSGRQSPGEQAQILSDLVVFSDSPWEVQAAIHIANERGLPLGVSESVEFTSTQEKRDALNALAEIEYCRLSKSCQPNGIVSLRACLVLGGCTRPTGMLDTLKQHTSARAYSLAERMSTELMKARSG